jgi:cytochrome c oxidase cbb3-type subunit IV
MDINDFRSIITVLSLLCFIGIVWWAFSRGSKKGFDEAANLPFAESDDMEEEGGQSSSSTDQRKTI